MKQNMSSVDRILRAIVGIVLLILNFTIPLAGAVSTLALIIAAILLVTALVGFCPLYAALKISTRKI